MSGVFANRLPRRVVSFGGTALLLALTVVAAPLVLVFGGLIDLARGRRSLPTVRALRLVAVALAIEITGLAMALFHWLATVFNTRPLPPGRWMRYRSVMGWYTSTLLRAVTAALGSHVVWQNCEPIGEGPVIVIARHTSFLDAVIPGALLARKNDLLPHHILAVGLRWGPCIDVVGHRFPNAFVRRGGNGDAGQREEMAAVGRALDTSSAGVIFAEGTFRTPRRFARAVDRLREHQPALAIRAEQLRHVLPPRTGGIGLLVEHAPAADVIVCANTGFEAYATLSQMLQPQRAIRPVTIETWRIPRHEVPADPDAFAEWLLGVYEQIDQWVDNQLRLDSDD